MAALTSEQRQDLHNFAAKRLRESEGEKEGRLPIVAVLATGANGEPDWRRGCGVLIGPNVSEEACPQQGKVPVFDCMVKAVCEAEKHGIMAANAADDAKHEIAGLAAIRN